MRAVPCFVVAMFLCLPGYAGAQQPQQQKQQPQEPAEKQKQEAQGLDMVSDTVASVFNKANALLEGKLEVTMTNKVQLRDDYTINAMGQRVPKSTAIKSGGALHNDQPL